MSLEQKVEFFKLLVEVGFKEIEVGFPAASETEYEFLRTLIEQDLIPEDVTVQVLTQAREHIIRKTFKALKGCKNAIVHVYNSTSYAQRQQVFKKSKEDSLVPVASLPSQQSVHVATAAFVPNDPAKHPRNIRIYLSLVACTAALDNY